MTVSARWREFVGDVNSLEFAGATALLAYGVNLGSPRIALAVAFGAFVLAFGYAEDVTEDGGRP